jgi:hypothetical protein
MCGADKSQKQIEQQQQQNFQTLTNQAQQIFGNSSQIFKDLTSSFSPIVAAGPGQSGFTPAELATLQSQAITRSGIAYRNAAQAAGSNAAGFAGGNTFLPSGATAQMQANIAEAGAGETANELANIDIQNAQLGRENWLQAAGVLGGATNVFNPSTSASGQATGAGEAAANTANQIAQANNSWMNALGGAIGQIGGAAVTGGLSKLGSGGGAQPAPSQG